MILYVVLFIMIFLGILVVQFHQFSRHAGTIAYRFEISEVAKQLAESAIDEAFARIWERTKGTAPSTSAEYKFLFDHQLNSSMDIPIKLVDSHASLPGYKILSSATLRIIDFQTQDRLQNYSFFPKEGVGTFQLSAMVKIQRGGKTAGQCHIIRHHDFKILTTTTDRATRSKYSQDFLLDYVLFVRKAYDEFSNETDPAKSSYNNPSTRLIIGNQTDLQKAGKIFFGGTDLSKSSDKPMFVNVSDQIANYKNLLPKLPGTPGSSGYTELQPRIDFAKCRTLSKKLDQLYTSSKKKVRDELDKVEGVFEAKIEPIHKQTPTTDPDEAQARQILTSSLPPQDIRRNQNPPSILFAEDPAKLMKKDYLDAVVEGAVRQRFLYLVRFWMDPSKVSGVDQSIIDQLKSGAQISAPLPPNPTPEQQEFCNGIKNLDPSSNEGLISKFDENFLWYESQNYTKRTGNERDIFSASPDFKSQTGGNLSLNDPKFRPYGSFMLRFRNIDYPDWLKYSGTYDPTIGEMELRGVVRVINGQVVLKGNGAAPIRFTGRGVIIADNGFKILSGIQKKNPSSDDFLVLFTQKSRIYVDTDQEIQASLMAIGNDGQIVASKKMKIFGSIAVDRLGMGDWAPGDHHLTFNPTLRNVGVDTYQVIPSPQITFQKFMESESDS